MNILILTMAALKAVVNAAVCNDVNKLIVKSNRFADKIYDGKPVHIFAPNTGQYEVNPGGWSDYF